MAAKSEQLMAHLGKILYFSHKLKTDERTDEELNSMLAKQQNCIYKKLCDITGFPVSQDYLIKVKAIETTIQYRDMIREREAK